MELQCSCEEFIGDFFLPLQTGNSGIGDKGSQSAIGSPCMPLCRKSKFSLREMGGLETWNNQSINQSPGL